MATAASSDRESGHLVRRGDVRPRAYRVLVGDNSEISIL